MENNDNHYSAQNNKRNYNRQNKNKRYNNQSREQNTKKIVDDISKTLYSKKEEILKELSNKIDKQVEISVSKRLKEEEKKFIRGKKGKIIRRDIFIILLIILICYLCCCLYDVNYKNIKTIITSNGNLELEKPPNSNNDEKEKKEEFNKYYIEKYGYLVENMQILGDSKLYIYKNKTTKYNMPNDIKLKIAYKNLIANKTIYEGKTINFKSEDLLDSYRSIFGQESILNNETFTYDNNRFIYYDNMYLGFVENNTSDTIVLYKIDDAYIEDEKLIFEVIVASKENNTLTNVLNNKVVLENYNNEDLSEYKDKLSKHKFVFIKVNDKYYFSSIDKMNDNL